MTYGVTTPTGIFRPLLKDPSGLELQGFAGYGNTDNPGLINGKLGTVGAGSLTNQIIDGQMVYRTGPTAAFTDTFDTAADLDAGVGQSMSPGDCCVIWYSNQVAYVATIAGNTGVTLASAKSTIAASALGCLVLQKVTNAVLNTPPSYNSQGQYAPTYSANGTYNLYVL
jgi:hypothetical protein